MHLLHLGIAELETTSNLGQAKEAGGGGDVASLQPQEYAGMDPLGCQHMDKSVTGK